MRTTDLETVKYGGTPFPYCVIDNFMDLQTVNAVHDEIAALNLENADHAWTKPNNPYEYNKFAFEGVDTFPPATREVLEHCNSNEFIAQLEKLTGINGLIRGDVKLRGAGVHIIRNGGRLALHTDFNTYRHPEHGKLDRRINLLLYMNKDWKPEYKGDLLLVGQNKPRVTRVPPTFNRCVIFNTTNKSVHGHPEELSVPNDSMCRKSLAVYYYTKNTRRAVDFEGDPAHCTLWYDMNKLHFPAAD